MNISSLFLALSRGLFVSLPVLGQPGVWCPHKDINKDNSMFRYAAGALEALDFDAGGVNVLDLAMSMGLITDPSGDNYGCQLYTANAIFAVYYHGLLPEPYAGCAGEEFGAGGAYTDRVCATHGALAEICAAEEFCDGPVYSDTPIRAIKPEVLVSPPDVALKLGCLNALAAAGLPYQACDDPANYPAEVVGAVTLLQAALPAAGVADHPVMSFTTTPPVQNLGDTFGIDGVPGEVMGGIGDGWFDYMENLETITADRTALLVETVVKQLASFIVSSVGNEGYYDALHYEAVSGYLLQKYGGDLLTDGESAQLADMLDEVWCFAGCGYWAGIVAASESKTLEEVVAADVDPFDDEMVERAKMILSEESEITMKPKKGKKAGKNGKNGKKTDVPTKAKKAKKKSKISSAKTSAPSE